MYLVFEHALIALDAERVAHQKGEQDCLCVHMPLEDKEVEIMKHSCINCTILYA
jgi:hypothetical protein